MCRHNEDENIREGARSCSEMVDTLVVGDGEAKQSTR